MGRQVSVQKFAERPFANKANTGGVFFGGIGQLQFLCQTPYFGLGDFTQRKQGAGKLGLIKPVQKITLVFAEVQCLEQLMLRAARGLNTAHTRSEEHTSELQSLMRSSY